MVPALTFVFSLSTKLNGERIDFGELVILGARVKARRLSVEDEAKRATLKRIAGMVRTRSFPYEMDVAAADEVKRLGLIAEYE